MVFDFNSSSKRSKAIAWNTRKYYTRIIRNNLLFHYVLKDFNEWTSYSRFINENNDLIIATDSGHDPPSKVTGIGVYIQFRKNRFYFYQSLGLVSNQYGELYAIAKIQHVLDKCKINIPIKRGNTFIITDSQISFNSILTYPSKPAHPTLLQNAITNVKNSKGFLLKVKAHTTPAQPHNNIADWLATTALNASVNTASLSCPSLSSFEASSLKVRRNGSTYCVSAEFWRRFPPEPD